MPKKSSLDRLFESLSDALYDAVIDASEVLREQATPTPLPPFPGAPRKSPGQKAPRRSPKPPKTRPSPPKPQESTLYDTLEVSPRCSPETLSAAFRSLSQKYHPDKNPGVTILNREECMKAITAAYSTLKDPVKRKQYDRSIGLK